MKAGGQLMWATNAGSVGTMKHEQHSAHAASTPPHQARKRKRVTARSTHARTHAQPIRLRALSRIVVFSARPGSNPGSNPTTRIIHPKIHPGEVFLGESILFHQIFEEENISRLKIEAEKN